VLKRSGQYEYVKNIAEEIERDQNNSKDEKTLLEKWAGKLDQFLNLIEKLQFKAEDVTEWPGFS